MLRFAEQDFHKRTLTVRVLYAPQPQADRSRLYQQILKWLKLRDKGIDEIVSTLGLSGRKPFFPLAEARLIELFRMRRDKGIPVSELWMAVTVRRQRDCLPLLAAFNS